MPDAHDDDSGQAQVVLLNQRTPRNPKKRKNWLIKPKSAW